MDNKVTDKSEFLDGSEVSCDELFQELIEGFALHSIILDDKGAPVNYRFIKVNSAFERMVGLNSSDIVGKLVLDILPKTEPFWIETYGKVATTGEPIVFEHFSIEQSKYYQVTSFCPKSGQFVTLFEDITTRKEAEDKLNEALIETKKMNEMMMGREIKMVELKNQVKELEDKVKELEDKLANK